MTTDEFPTVASLRAECEAIALSRTELAMLIGRWQERASSVGVVCPRREEDADDVEYLFRIRKAVRTAWLERTEKIPRVEDAGVCEGCGANSAPVKSLAGRWFCQLCTPGTDIGVRWKLVRQLRSSEQHLRERCELLENRLRFVADQPCERGKGELPCDDPMRGLDVTEFCLTCYARAALPSGEAEAKGENDPWSARFT